MLGILGQATYQGRGKAVRRHHQEAGKAVHQEEETEGRREGTEAYRDHQEELWRREKC